MRCNDDLLWTLVHQHDDPNDKVSGKLYRHLEGCQRCQQRLSDLAGGQAWMDETRQWIDPTILDVAETDSNESDLSGHIDLSFLRSPRHPEMLGRIGRYDVESVLGRGGMGVVFRGFDGDLQRTVAIKVLAPEWASSVAAKQRFAREAQAAASVAHENVVPIYNVGEESNPPYLVMQYIPGITLETLVSEHGCLDADVIIRIASQLASGLSAAHSRGLVHRDVKPANVLVGENTDRVWLTDFGLARAADAARLTRTGVVAGTPLYMSPEQARGEAIDETSDWFSLGCLLYFTATSRPPFEAATTLATLQQTISARPKTLSKIRPDLPPALVELIHQLLAKKPSRRPGCFEDVDRYLRRAEKENKGRRSRLVSHMRRRVLGLVAVVVGLAIATVLFETLRSRDTLQSAATSNGATSLSDDPIDLLFRSIDSASAWEDGFDERLSNARESIRSLSSQ